ncbi:MAG: DUF11 domain-containing protein [Planctomycetaceae bacterium]|nr:DUF11 domain-containing protein [Planctomycetaceae bacterium]
MLTGKMKEINKSVRGVYMRFVLLAVVVVFGAIAIAQAQKGKGKDALAEPAAISFDNASPVPLKQNSEPDSTTSKQVDFETPLPSAETGLESSDTESPDWQSTELPSDLAADPIDESNADLPALDDESDAGLTLPVAGSEPVDTLSEYDQGAYDQGAYDQGAYDQGAYDQGGNDQGTFEQDTTSSQQTDAGTDSLQPLEPVLPADTELDPSLDPISEQPVDSQASPADAVSPVDAVPASDQATLDPLPAAAAALQPYDTGPAPLPSEELAPAASDQSQLEYGTSIDQPLAPIEPIATSAQPSSVAFDQPEQGRFDVANRISNPPTGKPGPQTLEGPQSPTLTIEKSAPAEIQVGQPTKFEIRVRNTGQIAAENVLIRDEIPIGTKYVDSNPKATRATNDAIYWEIGSVRPNEDVVVSVDLMPTEEGQVGSVATVAFQASAAARTNATKPELVLEQTGPREALLGETVRFSIKLSNPGSGAATEVVLEEDVPSGLSHSSGSKLEYEVGTIQPGQTRNLELTLKASQAGPVLNTIMARARGGLEATSSVELAVVAPKLEVVVDGPQKRYLDRQATFSVAVKNPGTSTAHGVEVLAKLPSGLKFVSTNNSGYYDQSRHAVVWSLEKLPAGEMGQAQFTARPVEMGQYEIRAEGKSKTGLQASDDHAIAVEGIAALFFGLADQVDPIEVGGRTTYEIKVVNQGSKAASNVRIVALVPDGMKPVGAEGPTKEQVQGQKVFFEPMGRLTPQGEAIFRISVEGTEAGDHRFRVQMSSDDMTRPVIKEEGTRIYAD